MTRRDQAARSASCGGCGATWAGPDRCHCDCHHRTFETAAEFDEHRRTAVQRRDPRPRKTRPAAPSAA